MGAALLDQWRKIAYNEQADRGQLQKFWDEYFQVEKEIYEKLLDEPDTEVRGTVKELAEKYGQSVLTMVGFLDGINVRRRRSAVTILVPAGAVRSIRSAVEDKE